MTRQSRECARRRARYALAAGTSTMNAVPSGPVRSTAIRPPLAASSPRAIVSPARARSDDRHRVCRAHVGAIETFEDMVDVCGRDARALVRDADRDAAWRVPP